MRALIQRVTYGAVLIDDEVVSEIRCGYVILLGIMKGDTHDDCAQLVKKIVNLRIMSDDQGKMNKTLTDTNGAILLISQFTLCADITYGRRPSFLDAMLPDEAKILYEECVHSLIGAGLDVQCGRFGSYMDVRIHNDGPVTILIDTKT